MSIENYEELLINKFINVTSFGWSAPTLVADFGAGYQAGAVVSPYGLRRWQLDADVLPDSNDYTIEFAVGEDDFELPRFSYFLDFFQRHLMLGNKPFIITDPRTQKKYLVAFPKSVVESGFDANQLTAKILSGGTSLVERRAIDLSFNADGSINLDYTKPTGSLSVSQNGGLYAGTVTITASVSDNVAIQKVRFFIDHEFLSEDSTSTYTASWNTTLHKNGVRKVRAKVYDTSGNIAVLTTLINVQNDETPPTVSITSPTNGATVSGTISITATAADNISVDRVEFFYFDGLGFAPISQDSSSPYAASLDTTLLDDGSLLIQAIAFDGSGNPSDTASVTVNVLNDSEAPSIPEGIVLTGVTDSSFFGTFEPSTDNVGVTGYELQHALDLDFTDEDTIVDIGNTTSFNITNLDSDVEYYYRIRAYDAAGNFSDWSGIEFAHTDPEEAEPENWALTSEGATAAAFFWDGTGGDYSGETSGNYNSDPYHPRATINGYRHTNGTYGSNSYTGSALVTNSYGFSGHNILQVDLGTPRTIERYDIVALDSAASGTSDPRPSDTSTYAIKAFRVRYWNGSSWVTVATVSGNTLAWKQGTFTPVTAQLWRLDVTETGDNLQIRVCEFELWGV